MTGTDETALLSDGQTLIYATRLQQKDSAKLSLLQFLAQFS